MSLKAEQPFEDSRGGESLVPASMTQFGISDYDGFLVVDMRQCIVHLDASEGCHHLVTHPVKDIDRDIFHDISIGWVASAADGDGCRKSLGSSLQGVPNPETTHREAADINVFGIHGTVVDEAVHQNEHALHLRCRFALHLMLRQAPIGVHPTFPVRALRCHEEERIIASDGVIEEIVDAMFQLCSIVVTAFSSAVQEDDQWQGSFYGVGFFRAIKPIGKGVAACDVKVSLEQGCVGELSQRGKG